MGDVMKIGNKRNKVNETKLFNYTDSLCSDEIEQLKCELNATKESLDAIYTVLQNVTEPELIDCAIYELKSIQMRYTYLHKKISKLLL